MLHVIEKHLPHTISQDRQILEYALDDESISIQDQDNMEREKLEIQVYYNHCSGKGDDLTVTKKVGIQLMHDQHIRTHCENSFIGFQVKGSHEVFQFLRGDVDEWLLDIPICSPDLPTEDSWTLETFYTYINHDTVIEIMEDYFSQGELFYYSLIGSYDNLIQFIQNRWDVGWLMSNQN